MTSARRILVTGATGFLGRPACLSLRERGFEVHGVARTQPAGRWLDDVILHRADLLDTAGHAGLIEAVRPSHLLHLAWVVTPGRFWTDLGNLDWVTATLSLTRIFAENGGRRVVHVGSCAEYDWSHALLREGETPLLPHTLYGAAKLGLSTIVAELARQVGLSAAWGRMFFLYGPGEARRRLVSDVCASLLANEPIDCTLGTQLRDFMHVDDAAAALAALVDCDWNGPVNIASGETIAVREIVATLGSLAGRPELLRIGARPTNEGEPACLAAATEILREKIDFSPGFRLEEGLANTLDWWRGMESGRDDRRV
ncbi:NAD-dependent epimerase/dehydratase family protein [Bosea sp. (in: a-proteobacteria)]|uniref:NAD-dependent epimerase/dehydratase family protein n=1 Tax=Bosea sp. (in: a-proteobacteria) TaxID=1871050 RepID=UPI003B3AE427